MREWQPIATAPKDGRDVDLWANGARLASCWWFDGDDVSEPHWQQRYAEFPEGSFSITAQPTHWMPIPEAPRDGE